MNIQHRPIAKSQQKICTYTELRQQIHDDLRSQHPEWIEANGESPMCDAYEARLMEELDSFRRTGSNESVAAVRRTFRQANVNPLQRKTIPPKSSKRS
jgi:hypothetical protein